MNRKSDGLVLFHIGKFLDHHLQSFNISFFTEMVNHSAELQSTVLIPLPNCLSNKKKSVDDYVGSEYLLLQLLKI
jgi:hypothetical protein